MSEYPTYLIHYGIPNQKWGVRRYQNEDGTYTEEGLARRRSANQKELYRVIKRDVKRGTFDPKKYTSNEFIKSEIKKNNLKEVIADKNRFAKEYRRLRKNDLKRDRILSRFNDKVYKEANRKLKNKTFKDEDEKSLAFDMERQLAEDKYTGWKDKEYSKAKLSYKTKYTFDIGGSGALIKKQRDAALLFDKTAESILGKYSKKKINTLKTKDSYRRYVNDIIAESVNEYWWKEYRKIRRT